MRKQRFPPLTQRFWEKVTITNGCWTWTGSVRVGYGQIKGGGRIWETHRLSWEWAYGPVPVGLSVLHRCDNRRCVKPTHLFVGTQGDNVRDAKAKGRMATGLRNGQHTHPEKRHYGVDHWQHRIPERAARGERIGGSRLLPAQVIDIRRRRIEGWLLKDLAAFYGVTIGTIHFIVTGQTWKHLL